MKPKLKKVLWGIGAIIGFIVSICAYYFYYFGGLR